MKERVQTET